MLKIKFAIILLCLFSYFGVNGQVYPISTSTVTTCSGTFLDDAEGGSYSPTSYTFTICPDVPGNVIQIDFSAFSLWISPNPNSSDRLFIYDGPDVGSASLGSYTGTQLQGVQVTGTINNPTGCLTFVFQANPNGNPLSNFPGWEGIITCTTPCASPVSAAVITNPAPSGLEQTIGSCIGDPITFSDAGSFAQPGFTIDSYVWNLGDGTIDDTTGPVITHSYDEPGEYIVTLTVIDNNGCASINLFPLQVLVSTIPIFNTEFDSEICLGETATLDGLAIESTFWTSLPPQVVAGTSYLADGAGFSYSTSLTFDFFEPNAVLENCDDFLGFYVNMEHSYLGDLSMQLECPNGTIVEILNYPNGGGATYLGEAVDDGQDIPGQNVEGIGYTYTWSPFATNGNVNAQPDNQVSYVTTTGFNVTNDIVPIGTYQPDGNLCDFVGCPLNGSWTFTITDNLAADNGYIFYWGIDFDPSYFPDITTFTPVIGLDSDSTYWTGPNITDVSADGNVIEFTPEAVGQYQFTFFATNNFGCVQDTTVTVTVVPGPIADAGEDLFVCDDPIQMQGSVDGLPQPDPTCTYTIEMFDTFGDGWNGFNVTILEDGAPLGTFSVPAGGFANTATFTVNHGSSLQINTISGTFDNEVSYIIYNSIGDVFFEDAGTNTSATPILIGNNIFTGTADCQPGIPDYVYQWSPADGLSDPNIADPTVFVTENTTYTLTVWENGHPLCATTDEVLVSYIAGLDPGEDNTVFFCFFDEATDLNDLIGGNPSPDGVWTNAAGIVLNNTSFDPQTYPNGGTATFTYTVGANDCQYSSELTIIIETSAENAACCLTNAVVGENQAVCDLFTELFAEEPLGTGVWSSNPAGAIFSDANSSTPTVTVPTGGLYTFTFTDNNGVNCSESAQMTVNFSPEFVVSNVSFQEPTCAGNCDGSIAINVSGGIQPYSYSWSGGTEVPNSPNARENFCADTFAVTITDTIGCEHIEYFTFTDPPPPPFETEVEIPNCYKECNAYLGILAPNAVQFTFDGGATYGFEAFLDTLCAGIYEVGIIDIFGCENMQTVVVEEQVELVADFSYRPNPPTVLDAVLHFKNLSYPTPFDSSYWVFGNAPLLDTSWETNPVYEFPTDSAGVYPVMLIITNSRGCIDTIIKNVEVKDEYLFYIPNTFTPNGDGINELFRPVGNAVNLTDYIMQIFDRYGHLVFETRNFEEGWNGSINGKSHYGNDEVYIYKIAASSKLNLERYEYRGHVTMLR